MANNYLQFSFVIPHISIEEHAWIRVYLDRALAVADNDMLALSPDEQRDPFIKTLVDENVGSLGFQWSIEKHGPDQVEDRELWLYAEEGGDTNNIALFVQRFLKQFRPKGYVTFTWAETCSKMRVDEFSGGAAIITASRTYWMSPYAWFEQHRKRLNKRGLTEENA